jgi:60S ribosome subunit biogenesis protein NIP7
MRFRKLSKGGKKVLRSAGEDLLADTERLLKNRVLVVSIGGRKEVFAANRETYEVLQRLEVDPYFVGLYLGEIKNGRFLLGLEGGGLLAASCRKRIKVDEAVEQLVLYGRDVFINSIHEAYPGMRKGDRCLILNRRGEFLAVGRVEGKIIKNLLDRGWYLRKGE